MDYKAKKDLRGPDLRFCFLKNCWSSFCVSNIVLVVSTCIKTSSKYPICLFFDVNGLNMFRIKD